MESVNDYRCTFVSFASDSEKSEQVAYGYYFKKPASVRMEVRTGDYEGTVLLYRGTDVRVKLGHGILSWFSFSFDRTSRIVRDLRGNGIHESDWGWFVEQHLQMLPLTGNTYVGIDTINGRPTVSYKLTSVDPEKTRWVAVEYVWIDREDNTLVQYKQYDRSGRLIQSGLYQDVVLNPNLDDSVFTEFDTKDK